MKKAILLIVLVFGVSTFTYSQRNKKKKSEESSEKAKKEAPSKEEKWVKKVSLSIGGYKTSFQFSDPTTSLANAVNDALTVVGGAVFFFSNILEFGLC